MYPHKFGKRAFSAVDSTKVYRKDSKPEVTYVILCLVIETFAHSYGLVNSSLRRSNNCIAIVDFNAQDFITDVQVNSYNSVPFFKAITKLTGQLCT